KVVEGFADNYVIDNFSGDLPIERVVDLGDELLSLNNGLAARPTTADLTSTDPGKGAGMVALPQGGKVADAIRWIVPESKGAVGDGVTDDSAAVQAAIEELEAAGGGTLLLSKTYLIGGLTVTGEHIVFQGLCRENGFLVKSGTLGIHVQQSWVHFRNMRVWSEGTETDGLNTRGILYSKGSGSTGHVYNHDLNIQNFSGYGMEVRNT